MIVWIPIWYGYLSVFCPIGTILHFSHKKVLHASRPTSGEDVVTILPKKVKKIATFFFILLVICNFPCHFFKKYAKKNVFLWVLGQTSSPTLRDYLTTRYDLRARMNSKIFDDRGSVCRGWVPTSVIAPQGENWNYGQLKPPVLASDRYSDTILARNQRSALIGVECTFYFLRKSEFQFGMVISQSFVPLARFSIFLTKRFCTRVDQCLGNTWLKYCLKKWKKSQLFFSFC